MGQPQDVEILYVLAIFYAQGEQWPETRRFTEELVRRTLGTPGASELLGAIPPKGGD